MSPPAPPPRGWLRGARPSRFELSIALALVLAAVLPLGASLWLASRLAAENLALGLDPRVVDRLEATPALYGDLFQARKQLYAQQARALAQALPRRPEAVGPYLQAALERTPRLRRAAVLTDAGEVTAEAESTAPNPEGEWREAPARVALPGGGTLECVFAIEARFFAELDESRELAEAMAGVEALRAEIQRSYVRAFALLLFAWALGAGLLGWWLARRTTRRVTALVRATGELARGNLAVRVDPGRSADEVAELARAFNTMVAEVRESRDRIVYLEKISGWQDVARRLAHEIKNPLTPIQLAFQEVEAGHRRLPAPDPGFARLLAEAGEIVREEIGTLERLVGEFSAFAKLPEVRPEPSDLGDFAEEYARASPAEGLAAGLEVVRAAGPCPVALDRALMRTVLANLVRNAAEASRPQPARVHLGVARTATRGVLTVGDEGPGIPAELRERIFDPYFTTKSEGTGLGLAIAKKIVLQHGGEIEVGERPGGGAQFTLTFPLASAPGGG